MGKKTLRIERALEKTHEHGLGLKPPKTERGNRTITIDDDLIALLCAEREKHLRSANDGFETNLGPRRSWLPGCSCRGIR